MRYVVQYSSQHMVVGQFEQWTKCSRLAWVISQKHSFYEQADIYHNLTDDKDVEIRRGV